MSSHSQIELSPQAVALLDRIRARTARVGVVGLGYVGLPLAVEFAKAGFQVTGIDVSQKKVDEINAGSSYVQDVPSSDVRELVSRGLLRATADFSVVSDLDTVNIAVPTPLRKTKDPDMSFVVSASQEVARRIHPGMLVILESTTYPGTTEELLLPMFQSSGLRAGRDFFLCFSPERVDPGNPKYQTKNIPKVVGGITPACTEVGAAFYSMALDTVVPVSNTVVAEMVKLLENTFRMINIGLVNELAVMCHRMNINVWEVIDAAATKPFGFMPFYPGPGLGGHCIPIDPFYLSWKSKQAGIEARFIELAGHINGDMPRWVVSRIQDALNDQCKPLTQLAHPRPRRRLQARHRRRPRVARARHHPPACSSAAPSSSTAIRSCPNSASTTLTLRSSTLEALSSCDCAVIVTDHRAFDYDAIVRLAPLILDTRNALKGRSEPHILRL